MPIIRLTPSTIYNAAGTSYLSVSNANNAYTNTDSDTYATIQNLTSSTSNRYIYLRGFNFDDIPSAAIVSSFSIKLKARESGIAQSSSYNPYLANGTTAINGSCSYPTTTVQTHTFSGISADWDTIKSYGDNFGIRINCRRASRNTVGYMYIYGAEIEVTYTVPTPRTITTTVSGDGTISPSGITTTYDGEEFELTITPTNKSDTITAARDGVDITDQLVAHGVGSSLTFTADSYTTSGISSGSSYAQYAVGYTAQNPNSYAEDSNMYASSGSTGYTTYSFDFSNIPSNATIEDIEVRCYGHRESSTIDSSHVSQCVLYQSSTVISEEVDFPSTSSSMITITPTDMPTRSELNNVTLRHYVGYYGGLVEGITFAVTYSTGGGIDHYTYTFTVSGDSTIVVVIGSAAATPSIYIKNNNTWVEYTTVYKKINGTWTLLSDLTSAFESGVNYVKGGT